MDQQQPSPFPELDKIKAKAQETTDRVDRLKLIKEWVDKAKVMAAEGQGQIKQLELQRAQEYGCPTDEEAEEEIKELQEGITILDQEIETGVQTLMEAMEWAT